ncbi:phosphonate ABC transporter ATP-binding protein, partial [Candidatus Magnetomorum sp. HK-1]
GYIKIIKNTKDYYFAHKKRSCIVRQKAEDNLALDLTVKENIMLRLKPNSFTNYLFPSIYFHDRINKILNNYSELKKKLNQPCKNLSGGQKQTLAFLLVTLNNSSLLLLDEFLSATDQNTKEFLNSLSQKYALKSPACVIIVSHEIELALENADRILTLKKGKLVSDINSNDPNWNKNYIKSMISL